MKIAVGAEKSLGYWDPYRPEPEKETPRRMEICVVCGLEIAEPPTFSCPHCSAVGHESCFTDWLTVRNSCPMCRRPIMAEVA